MAALAGPILVHLVRRSRAPVVVFPSLMFVRRVPQRTVRRKRLHNLLLLLLRCLAMLLLVLAFTRPYLTNSNLAAVGVGNAGVSVILIDTSLSMRYGNRFEQAKSRARALLDESLSGEQAALVTFNQGYQVLSRFTAEKGRLQSLLNNVQGSVQSGVQSDVQGGVQVGLNGTDYEQALRGAEELLREMPPEQPKRIFLVSDFQATGWNKVDPGTFRLRRDIKLVPVGVGEEPAPNLAITDLSAQPIIYEQKYTDKLAVRISNFSDEARERVNVEFQINDQPVEKREVNIPARDAQLIEFTNFNLSAGDNRAVVTVGGNDKLALDDRFYFTLSRDAQAKALIVETALRGQGSESLYLRNALTTGENLPFAVTVKTAGATNPAELGEYRIILLNDAGGTGGISPALAEALTKFVERGGGLLIAAGPHTEASEFNRVLGRLAPATLGDRVQLPRGERVRISEVTGTHPIFEPFQQSGRIAAASVFGYRQAEPHEQAAVLARFEDGRPALIEKSTESPGKVLLFTSSLDAGWTDLPLTPLYLPFMRQIVRYLGEPEASAWHPLGQAFTVAKSATDGTLPAVDTPSEKRLTERIETASGDLIITGREPGFYHLRYPDQARFAAVNLAAAESDLTKLNLDEFVAAVSADKNLPTDEASEARPVPNAEQTEATQRIWWPLLIIALMLFVAEALLARRTKMAKMIG